MKTTLDIDDELYREVESLSRAIHQPISAIVEDALKARLHSSVPGTGKPFVMEVSKAKGGLMPGVDLDKTSELMNL